MRGIELAAACLAAVLASAGMEKDLLKIIHDVEV